MWDQELIELATVIEERCHLRGDYLLKSGLPSSDYFDKYAFESDPSLLQRIVERMAALIPPGTEVLGGLELGGIPLATLLSVRTGLPVVFVRKQAKTYGTKRIVEGRETFGATVLLVDDVITTGGATRDAAIALRAEGAVVGAVVCAVDRTTPDATALSDAGVDIFPVLTGGMLAATAVSTDQPDALG